MRREPQRCSRSAASAIKFIANLETCQGDDRKARHVKMNISRRSGVTDFLVASASRFRPFEGMRQLGIHGGMPIIKYQKMF